MTAIAMSRPLEQYFYGNGPSCYLEDRRLLDTWSSVHVTLPLIRIHAVYGNHRIPRSYAWSTPTQGGVALAMHFRCSRKTPSE
jgi:hypothetical protein